MGKKGGGTQGENNFLSVVSLTIKARIGKKHTSPNNKCCRNDVDDEHNPMFLNVDNKRFHSSFMGAAKMRLFWESTK